MKCTEIKKLLPDYSVGALSHKKRETIRQHLDSCPECRRELISLEKTAALLDAIPQEEPPAFMWRKVKREITQQEQIETPFWQKIGEWLWWKRIPAMAAGLAVLILTVGLYFVVWQSPTEQSQFTLQAEMEQQTFSHWNTSFADRAALGMLVINTNQEGEDGENHETYR